MAPQTRTIPAGKILLAEYGEVNDADKARVTILERNLVAGREYLLVHSTPGFESAGSCMRWTNGFYGVRFHSNGAINGRQFKTEQEARDMMRLWTDRRGEYAVQS